jgi:hypothetical protein
MINFVRRHQAKIVFCGPGGGASGSSGGSGNGSTTHTIGGVSKSGGFGAGKTVQITSNSFSGDLCTLSRAAIVGGASGTQLAKDARVKAVSAGVAGLGTVGQNVFCR